MTAHNTMLNMSESACSLFSVSLRGSGTLSKYGFGFGNIGSSLNLMPMLLHLLCLSYPSTSHSAFALTPGP